MAIINGIQLLHKRYADWSGKTLQAGELGLNLTTLEVRIGTAANQSWENASLVSCKVAFSGEGKHITNVTYENGVVTIVKGTLSYNDLNDKPALNFEAAGAVAAHNTAEDAHSDIRTAVGANATAIANEKSRAEGKEAELAQAIADEQTRAEKKEGELQAAINTKVASETYTAKVNELAAEDLRIANLVAQEVTDRGAAIQTVTNAINTEKGRIDTLEDTTIPGINSKIKDNSDAIKALEGLATSGLSRQVVTELPSVDTALENVIYMILRADNVGAEGQDIYDEYLLMGEEGNKRFELLGNTAVDLTDYYTKSEVYTKEEANTAINNAVNPVSQAVAKEVTDREGAVKGVQDQLDVLKSADTVDGSIAKTVKSAVAAEALLRENADNALDGRIDALEALQLQAGSTYATKTELGNVSKAVEDEASRAAGEEARIEGLVNGLTTRMGTAEGKITEAEGDIDDLEAAVAVINGEAEGSIKKAVADEATLRAEEDAKLAKRVGDLEAVKYTGEANGPISVDGTVIKHAKTNVAASEDFGFYALKVDEYGHIVGVQAITTLDGNLE